MTMRIELELLVDPLRPARIESDLFSLEEAIIAEEFARLTRGAVYCWKTSGVQNWLERGLSIVDVLGLIVLPSNSPDFIGMSDDAPTA